MDTKDIVKEYYHRPEIGSLIEEIGGKKGSKFFLSGLSGSSKSLLASAVVKKIGGFHLFLFSEKEEAAYFYNDLTNLLDNDSCIFLPSSYKRSVQYNQVDNGNVILRTHALKQIADFKTDGAGCLNIISYPEGLIEKVITHKKLSKSTLQLIKGEKISIEFIHEVLEEYGFKRVDFVYEPGQYSIRGGIVDIFSYSCDFPFRIDFFGDEVESIRSFDIENQTSKAPFDKISIIPNIQDLSLDDVREPFWNYLTDAIIWTTDARYICNKITQLYEDVILKNNEDLPLTKDKSLLLTTGNQLMEQMVSGTVIEMGHNSIFPNGNKKLFNTSPQPSFNKNFALLSDNLNDYLNKGYTIYIFSDNQKQIDRLLSIFHDTGQPIKFTGIIPTLHEGYIDHDTLTCFYTDHQIFERFHKFRISSYFSNKASLSLKEIKGLQPGDYVVHIDHGIGQFGGLIKVEDNGKFQEVIKLVYKDNDVLLVSIHALHRISKYKGKDDSPPKVYKLGTGAWQKLKQSTKKKVKDIAKDLIALYAKRKSQQGFRYSADTYLQDELEASFLFEDTPDQIKSTIDVKSDMESNVPMDRLICGDVGFGKTEIAIRAAFKAVADSKQVALLVPTTILALQHYNTFRERLKDFPCSVDYISRLKSARYQKGTLENLAAGKLDIIIGTHRLVGKDVIFKDLGLLIIDEEQKFGVAIKEKLKKLKLNVDTLTLSATPIPRTLQFSMMGARDLSIINTPPPNRHPIITELHTFNADIIQEGIDYEVSRGGQVYFIHNRIQNISEIENLIRRVCPKVKTVVAHGQMEGKKLEKIMLDFISGDYDVLIATTIIESGLDIPNVNTIFINNAQNFGLSDLHQLRGRVGRSNRRAFCFLMAPPLTSVTPEARRRLHAIEEFSDLGSGFNIALQDLDIRGAGNLLGSEQSGFIADIGFETYNRILDEALRELKESEYKEFYDKEPEQTKISEDIKFVQDCYIDTDMELMFPDEYVNTSSERIFLYRELDNISSQKDLDLFEANLIDRFGRLPQPTIELLLVVKLRWMAIKLGFEKIILKNNTFIGHFISNQESLYYQSPVFSKVLNFVQSQPGKFKMKESKNRLSLTVEGIRSIQNALDLLEKMIQKE
ncbi:MAG: transcription-repair coupling factor [Bacteroidales bacterium]|nr:transcription-repair coupling factor [Bacteroidales bacterium]